MLGIQTLTIAKLRNSPTSINHAVRSERHELPTKLDSAVVIQGEIPIGFVNRARLGSSGFG